MKAKPSAHPPLLMAAQDPWIAGGQRHVNNLGMTQQKHPAVPYARWPAGAPTGSAVAGRPAHQFIGACLAASHVTGIEKAHGLLATPPEQMGRRHNGGPLPHGGLRNFEVNPEKKAAKTQVERLQETPR